MEKFLYTMATLVIKKVKWLYFRANNIARNKEDHFIMKIGQLIKRTLIILNV